MHSSIQFLEKRLLTRSWQKEGMVNSCLCWQHATHHIQQLYAAASYFGHHQATLLHTLLIIVTPRKQATCHQGSKSLGKPVHAALLDMISMLLHTAATQCSRNTLQHISQSPDL